MEEKVKEIVEIKQRSLAEENQKTLEALKERYSFCWGVVGYNYYNIFRSYIFCYPGKVVVNYMIVKF